MQPLGLTVGQKADLVAFLQGATLDPRVATAQPPFDRPTLHSETARVPVSYGLATAGTAGVLPQLIAVEPPMLGNPSWTLGFSDGLAGAAGLLMIGDARETSGRSLLGVALAVDPMRLQVVPLAALRTSANTGFTSLSLPIPNVAPLGGAAVYLQAAFVDAGASQGFSATAGAQATLFAPR